MRKLLLILLWVPLCLSTAQAASAPESAAALEQLLQDVRQSRQQELAENRVREQRFLAERDRQRERLQQARDELAKAQALGERLSSDFDRNENKLAELEQLLQQKSGNLGELFGVVKQTAGDLKGLLKDSLISAQYPNRNEQLLAFADSKKLPSVRELEQLWFALQQEMTAAGQVVRFPAQVIGSDGNNRSTTVTRIGPFTAVADGQFLTYSADTGLLTELPRQPDGQQQAQAFEQSTDGLQPMQVDPTRGAILSMLVQKPTLVERLQQGGIVGYIIITLGAIGLLIALVRLLTLMGVRGKVKRQLKQLDEPHDNNPLGRILAVYRREQQLDVESLELKLDEAVLQETPALESGQSLIKLLAAVAPLLGLLGTVTGMIGTFQAITLFGTGDPKLMAGGISQALMTTVLGLVVAIPLLFGHSLVASRSRGLIQILDEKSAGLLARRIEADASQVYPDNKQEAA